MKGDTDALLFLPLPEIYQKRYTLLHCCNFDLTYYALNKTKGKHEVSALDFDASDHQNSNKVATRYVRAFKSLRHQATPWTRISTQILTTEACYHACHWFTSRSQGRVYSFYTVCYITTHTELTYGLKPNTPGKPKGVFTTDTKLCGKVVS